MCFAIWPWIYSKQKWIYLQTEAIWYFYKDSLRLKYIWNGWMCVCLRGVINTIEAKHETWHLEDFYTWLVAMDGSYCVCPEQMHSICFLMVWSVQSTGKHSKSKYTCECNNISRSMVYLINVSIDVRVKNSLHRFFCFFSVSFQAFEGVDNW